MSEYLLINIAIIIIPFAFSFEKNIKFYTKWPAVFTSMLLTGIIYIGWDIFATMKGDWSFNPEFISGIKILHLPIEEILFFVTVPYASLFLYETINFYIRDKKLAIFKRTFAGLAFFFFIAAIAFYNRNYTFLALLFTGFVFLVASFTSTGLFNRKIYWIYILVMFLPFLIVNYLLTSLPVVLYNSNEIWRLRLLTIPLEDFFYSFSMLSIYLLIYLHFKEIWKKEKK